MAGMFPAESGPANVRVDTVIAGGGETLTRTLELLCRSPAVGRVLIVTDNRHWTDSFPRDHKMGQSVTGLSAFDAANRHDANQHMTVDHYRREMADRQIDAVFAFGDDQLQLIEGVVLRAETRGADEVVVTCDDGSEAVCKRLILCTGVGPERTLAGCGVKIIGAPGGARGAREEATTALAALAKTADYSRGTRVMVYGGGATAAWVIEGMLRNGVEDLLWVSRNGFGAANPNGRNSHIMRATEGVRWTATMESVQYRGNLTTGSGLRVQMFLPNGTPLRADVDLVICSAGADPDIGSGIRHVLRGGLYDSLVPVVGDNGGVVATTRDQRVIVTSTPLTLDRRFRALIEDHSFGVLEAENHVAAGIAVSRLSGELAAQITEGSA